MHAETPYTNAFLRGCMASATAGWQVDVGRLAGWQVDVDRLAGWQVQRIPVVRVTQPFLLLFVESVELAEGVQMWLCDPHARARHTARGVGKAPTQRQFAHSLVSVGFQATITARTSRVNAKPGNATQLNGSTGVRESNCCVARGQIWQSSGL